MRRRVIYIVLLLAILAVILYSPLTSYLVKDFLTYKLEKALDMDIVLGKTRVKFPVRIAITDIRAIDRKGAALVAESALFHLDASKLFQAKVVLKCDLRNVSIKSGFCNSLNELLRPLGVPPQDNYIFESVNGVITLKKDFFKVEDLKAAGVNFKFSGYFTRFNDRKLDYDIEFDINKEILKAEDDKAGMFLMGEDKDGWYSTRFSLKGDPHRPSSVTFSTGGVKFEVRPSAK